MLKTRSLSTFTNNKNLLGVTFSSVHSMGFVHYKDHLTVIFDLVQVIFVTHTPLHLIIFLTPLIGKTYIFVTVLFLVFFHRVLFSFVNSFRETRFGIQLYFQSISKIIRYKNILRFKFNSKAALYIPYYLSANNSNTCNSIILFLFIVFVTSFIIPL